MLQRCENPKATGYSIYGGRGIIIDDRWRVFENFLADMGERPPGTTLDRRDNDGNYDVDNCRWATASEQRVNQRPRAKLSPEIRRERDRDRHRAAARRKEAA